MSCSKKGMLRFFSPVCVFSIGVLITYFLSDFYNDINDKNKLNFSIEETTTLVNAIDERVGGDERGFMYASGIKTFPGITLEQFRSFGALPGFPPLSLGEDLPDPRPDIFIFIRRVFNEDREEFERQISEQYNQTLKIVDYITREVVPEKGVYWPIYFHVADARVIAADISTEPDRFSALNSLLDTGNISYSTPVVSQRFNTTNVFKMIEVLTTQEGDLGIMARSVNFIGELEENTNILQFLEGGYNGRRVVLYQIQNGVKYIVYENGYAPDLIYEGEFRRSLETVFLVEIYDEKNPDNSTETLVFMSIGIVVAIVMAIWELFRSRASIRAEESSLAKSKFLSNISHEIRTPINGIVGISDILSKEILPPNCKNYVNIINSCSSSLLSLLNNVLDMSKIDAGKMETITRNFRMKPLVVRTVRDTWEVLLSKNTSIDHIEVTFTENVPVADIISSDTHIFQILNNLLSNAVKFTDRGHVEIIVDASYKNYNTLLISMDVKDTGIGMSEDSIKSLFKPFNRIHNGSNEKSGTGLGLVISMSLIKAMGGDITCESIVGEGTTFRATFEVSGVLPVDAKSETIVFGVDGDTDTTGSLGHLGQTTRVINVVFKKGVSFLIVDDNKTNLLVLRNILESIGAYDIDSSNDGEECILLTSVKKYDLIFIDKFMPVMDGLEAMNHIRHDSNSLNKISSIILMSADVEDRTVAECMNAGANGFIGKPYRLAGLIEKIDSVNPDVFA